MIRKANAGEPEAVAQLHELLHQPAVALREDGEWHQRYIACKSLRNRAFLVAYTSSRRCLWRTHEQSDAACEF